MITVSNNNIITITRGDTATVYFDITVDYTSYQLTEGDKVYFGVMEPNKQFETAIIKKVLTSENIDKDTGKLAVHFKSEDTEFLLPGVYYYELKLFRPGKLLSEDPLEQEDKVDTLVRKKKFIIF